mmetsp:Transcript_97113/g.312988  ORF Transcript_97113/g.312988 Transcript_97113/m.312988 type:complete len:162 (+) Transcript_97113:88-573(+)
MSSRDMTMDAQEYGALLSVKGGEVDAEMQVQAKKVSMSKQDYAAQVAGGKIIHHMMDTDYNECGMSASIYDAAFVIPQITRSAGNPRSLVTMTIRSYMFLFGNFFLQLFILYMIAQVEQVMDKFAGEMNLCNFRCALLPRRSQLHRSWRHELPEHGQDVRL